MSKRTQSSAKSAAPQEYRKPRADVYTLLLVVALMILILATAALWKTMDDYQDLIKGGPTPVWHRPATGTLFDPPCGIA